jgi:peptidyl-prolyl cis-trans isomerase D|tara:strand:+ start:109 stop:2232 length:2124 start_codon:yes stop_codon:yes gene_type:complete
MALINTLRQKAGKIVVGFVAFSMFSFILTDLFQGNSFFNGGSNDIGEINSNTISYPQFQQKVDELSQNFQLNTGRSPLAEDLEQIRQQAWQQFIIENIFNEQYAALGLDVTTSELIDMVQGVNIHPQIRQIFADPNTGVFEKQNIISFLQQLNNAPQQQRQSWLTFEASLPASRKLTKYENLLALTKYANIHEAKAAYEKNASLTAAYLYVPFFSLNDSLVTATESELESYLSKNADQYKRDASKDAKYVIFPIAPSSEDSAFVEEEMVVIRETLLSGQNDSVFAEINSDGITAFGTYNPNNLPSWLDLDPASLETGYVSDLILANNAYSVYKISDVQEGDEYYLRASHILFKAENETASAKAQTKKEAQRVLGQLKRGAEFAEMARMYGTDGTATRGGDLGWFGENSDFDQKFKEASFAKRGKGLLSNVVETSFGYHIITVTEAKINTIYKIAQVEKELFSSDQTLNTIYRQAELFAAENSNEVTFSETATEKGYEIRKAMKVGKDDKFIGGLTDARNIVFWLFNEASNDEVSEVFELDNKYVVAIQTGAQEEGTAKMEDVINELKRKVLDDKKAALIISRLSALSGPYDEINTAYGSGGRIGVADLTLSANNIPNIGFAPEAIGVAFSLEEGEATLPFKIQNGVIMLTISTKTPLEELSDYEAYRSVVLNAQTEVRRREDPFTYQSIYNALIESVDIVDNRYEFY